MKVEQINIYKEALHTQWLSTIGAIGTGLHKHNTYELFFAISNEGSLIVNNKIYPFKKYDAFLFNSNDVHKVVVEDECVYQRYVTMFQPDFIKSIFQENIHLLRLFEERPRNFCNKISLNSVTGDKIISLLDQLVEMTNSDNDRDILLEWLIFSQVLTLINHYNPISEIKGEDYKGENSKISEILKYIDKNFTEKLSLDLVAEKFHFNKYYLSRCFKQESQISFNDYIMYKRLEYAIKLMNKEHSLLMVAQRAGFSSESYFSTTFKKIIGITPKKYIEEIVLNEVHI